MRSPHTIEIQFVFNNIKIAGPLISKMPEAYALAEKVSAAWVSFARTGNPNVPKLPKWPAYSVRSRDTMLFNNESRGAGSRPRPRLVMEQALKLIVIRRRRSTEVSMTACRLTAAAAPTFSYAQSPYPVATGEPMSKNCRRCVLRNRHRFHGHRQQRAHRGRSR